MLLKHEQLPACFGDLRIDGKIYPAQNDKPHDPKSRSAGAEDLEPPRGLFERLRHMFSRNSLQASCHYGVAKGDFAVFL